jgi:hypothetical protein
VSSIAYGLAAVWLYSLLTARFGQGWRTAALAGAVVSVIGYLLPMVGYAGRWLFPTRLVMVSSTLALIDYMATTTLSAWRYRH